VPAGTPTGSIPVVGEAVGIGERDAPDPVADGGATASPPHAASTTSAVAQIARRITAAYRADVGCPL